MDVQRQSSHPVTESLVCMRGATLPPGCQDAPPPCEKPRKKECPVRRPFPLETSLGLVASPPHFTFLGVSVLISSFVILSLGLKAGALSPGHTPLPLIALFEGTR